MPHLTRHQQKHMASLKKLWPTGKKRRQYNTKYQPHVLTKRDEAALLIQQEWDDAANG